METIRPFEKMDSSNTALLAIDVVNSCAHERCESKKYGITFSKIRKMVPKLTAFVDEFRKSVGGMVIFTKNVPWRKEYLPESINELYEDPSVRYYSDDATGFPEEFYMVEPQKDDVVITKNTNDAIANKDLVATLQSKEIKYLVVTGIFTDGCVLASVMGGFSRGYSFVILKDLVETTDVEKRQQIQRLLIEYTFPYLCGRVVGSKDFLETW